MPKKKKYFEASLALDITPPKSTKGRKKKSADGKPIKMTAREQQAEMDRKSARELQAEQVRKQGKDLDELIRVKGGRKRKPKGKAAPKPTGGAKITTKKVTKKPPKKKVTKKSSPTSKKTVAKGKAREYSTHPSAVRSREYRARKKAEAEAKQKASKPKRVRKPRNK